MVSGSYSNRLEDLVPQPATVGEEEPSAVELLIRRIQAIQEELSRTSDTSEEEQAFLEAAEDQLAALSRIRAVGVARHRRG